LFTGEKYLGVAPFSGRIRCSARFSMALIALVICANSSLAGTPPPEIVDYSFCFSPDQVVPDAPDPTPTSSGTGTLHFVNETQMGAIHLEHDVANATAVRMGFAPEGNYGDIVYTFPSATSPIDVTIPLSGTIVGQGFYYIEIL
jgi:hypothetical protein